MSIANVIVAIPYRRTREYLENAAIARLQNAGMWHRTGTLENIGGQAAPMYRRASMVTAPAIRTVVAA